MAAVRGVIAPAMDPRVAAERARVLRARARLSCWLAIGVIPFTIVTYNAAFFPGQLVRGAALVTITARSSAYLTSS